MFNTMTITKIGGALCGALLVFLLLNWVANTIYFSPAGHGEHAEAAYLLEIEEEEAEAPAETPAEETADTGSDSGSDSGTDTASAPAADTGTGADTGTDGAAPAATMVAGDPEKGEKVFKKCKACHKVEAGENITGPTLYQIVGRDIASVEGFSYSGGMNDLEGDWTPEMLDTFLTKPKDMIPDTKMSFAGLRKEEDRADVIAYLATLGH